MKDARLGNCVVVAVVLVLQLATLAEGQKHPIPFLHQACLDGNHELVKTLIDTYVAKGGRASAIEALNRKDHVVGVPPLYAAATNGHLRVVKVLIQVINPN